MATKNRNLKKNNQQNIHVINQNKLKDKEQDIIDSEFVIQKLINEKEDLEKEFEEILRFILEDMKKQEEFLSKALLLNDESNDGKVSYYKDKCNEANKNIQDLEKHIDKLQKRVYSLENSTLGKITLKYWEFKNKLRKK